MMSKKKRKTPAAQQLIDSLLDERTPTGGISASERSAIGEPVASNSQDSRSLEIDQSSRPGSNPADELTRSSVVVQSTVKNERDVGDDVTLQLPKKPKSAEPVLTIDDGKTNPSVGSVPTFGSVSASASSVDQQKPAERSAVDRLGITELKTVVKMRDRYQDLRTSTRPPGAAGGGFSSSEAALKQSESLRIAQTRISEMETELERLRRENEQLVSAGETLRRRSDEMLTKAEQLDLNLKESERIHSEEKKVFRGQLSSKDREINDLRGRLEEMEGRLESNFKKIRVRERELEHRLEIVRMESQTLVATKDKMLLELKRQIDQITHENDFAKQKSQEHFNQFKEKQETIRRVVRALRIALTILEGDEDSGIKKPD
jgi:hypothetical protein